MRPFAQLAIVISLLLTSLATSIAGTAETDAQRRVAERFLRAYLLRDMKAIKHYVPTKLSNLFGPYPFTGPVKLGDPKVDDNQALIDFRGPVADPKFPSQGGLLFRRVDGVWYIRQVLYYDKVPMIFGLPKKSPTERDRLQEPKIRSLGLNFLEIWKRGDDKTIETMWYDWIGVPKEPIDGLSMSNLVLVNSITAWRDPYIQYTAKLTYRFGPLGYSMNIKGGLILIREGEDWKVRPNELVFDF